MKKRVFTRRPLTPVDRLFQGPPTPYTPGSLAKKPLPAEPDTESTPAKRESPPDKK